jgi:hypothetical protein
MYLYSNTLYHKSDMQFVPSIEFHPLVLLTSFKHCLKPSTYLERDSVPKLAHLVTKEHGDEGEKETMELKIARTI